MGLLAKAVVVGGVAVVATSVGVPLSLVSGSSEDDFWTLLDDAGFLNSSGQAGYTYGPSYVKDYARFFVGTVSPTKGSYPRLNRHSWWNWSFKHRYDRSAATGGFKNVESGGTFLRMSNYDNALVFRCQNAYHSPSAQIIRSPQVAYDHDRDKFQEEQLWRYCSWLGHKPRSVEEASESSKYGSGKLGHTYKGHMLSIDAPENREMWEKLQKQFTNNPDVTGFFSGPANGVTLKDKCRAAYGQTSIDTLKGLYAWCSLSGYK